MHAGSPFAKKGGAELSLPKMDIPIGMMEWEVFLPQQYKVADFGGDAIAARLLPVSENAEGGELPPLVGDRELAAGGIGGTVTDQTGAAIAGATLLVISTVSGSTLRAVTDGNGRWVFSNVPSGLVKITASSPGFRTEQRDVIHNVSRGSQVDLTLRIGDFSEAAQVTTNSSVLREERPRAAKAAAPVQDVPVVSRNVLDLQRRVAGVLPIAVSIPKTGAAYHFVRPLVVEEETKLTFSYRSK